MGRMYTEGLAGEVDELVDLNAALCVHLRSNHYPPVPTAMVGPCVAAIDAANDGDWDLDIDLEGAAEWRGNNFAPAWAIIEGHHLEPFLSS